MKPVVPIVGISKMIEPYGALICGFDGVVSCGDGLSAEALEALKKVKALGKEIVLFSNSALRVSQMAELFEACSFDLRIFKAMITAGEIAHYELKNTNRFGKRYFNIGRNADEEIFKGLDYQKVFDINEADFIFISSTDEARPFLEDYLPELQMGLALNLPMFCVGTDVSKHQNGEVCLGVGMIAEQYAAMGGRISAIGKPDEKIVLYAKEAISKNVKKILFVGDSFTSDMKSAIIIGADMLLISKGVHMSALGEGYIPDVQKVRTLALNYGVYPDFVISKFRY
ncbi:MAG: TIGR01459 family HAD-type hydrolase [Alphaproteobacteria bacterium]|nr:TIGR01459 family HAD-type hydrolase [Alphaproteobacteria bacterium]